MRYAYYPGCSSENLSAAYESSFRLVAEALGIELTTVPDWNCCGGTQYMAVSRLASYAISARNLALVPAITAGLLVSCSACFLNLQRADRAMQEHPEISRQVNSALKEGGLSYHPGTLWIRHILDVFNNDIGLEYIQDRVRTPLAGLTVAPYYGCMLVRPRCSFDHTEYPTSMDGLLEALGARVAPFSLRGYCCSGHLPHIKADTGFSIIHRILKNAQYDGADVIAVACPVCQVNLDLYQQDVNEKYGTDFDIPVLFFTQLMGLAFGLDQIGLGVGNEIVAAGRKLEQARKGGRPRNDRTMSDRPAGLPMPDMEKDDFR